MDQPGNGDLRLDDQLCFALYSASRAIVGRYRPLLERLGLTYSQYLVMLLLWEHETLDFGRLCTDLHLDSGSLSPVVKRLESHGLVRRRRRERDERTVEVSCTAAGRALHDSAHDAQREVQAATGLTSGDLARLRDELNLLSARLRSAGLDEPAFTP